MKKIIEFICENYELLILLAACLLDLILFLCGVFKKSKKSPSIEQVIYGLLPQYIREAEQNCVGGLNKLYYVVDKVKTLYHRETGSDIADGSYMLKWIVDEVENILNTPQKKGKKE